MMRTVSLALAAALLAAAAAPTHRARADAWSAAAATEAEAIRVHPWDPESFRHPELYAPDGRKITGPSRRAKRPPH
jgi:hypothetical protein